MVEPSNLFQVSYRRRGGGCRCGILVTTFAQCEQCRLIRPREKLFGVIEIRMKVDIVSSVSVDGK